MRIRRLWFAALAVLIGALVVFLALLRPPGRAQQDAEVARPPAPVPTAARPRARSFAEVKLTLPNSLDILPPEPVGDLAVGARGLRGRCVRADGTPLAGASVQLASHETGPRRIVARADTTADGTFDIRVPDALGPWLTLRVLARPLPERVIALRGRDVESGRDVGTIVIPGGTRVRGVVLGDSGSVVRSGVLQWSLRPSAGAQSITGNDAGSMSEGEVALGDDGRFDLGELPAGWLECDVGESGRTQRAGWYRVPATVAEVEILVRLSSLVGRRVRVTTSDGSVPSEIHCEPVGGDNRLAERRWPLLADGALPDHRTVALTSTFGGPVIVRAPGYRRQVFMVTSGIADLGEILLVPGRDAVTVSLLGARPGEPVAVGVIGRGRRAVRFPALTRAVVGPDSTILVDGPLDPIAPGEAILAIRSDGAGFWRTRVIEDADFRVGAAPVPAESAESATVSLRAEGAGDAEIVLDVVRDWTQGPVRPSSWGDETMTASGWVPVRDVVARAAAAGNAVTQVRLVPGFVYRCVASAPEYAPTSIALGPDLPPAATLPMSRGAAVRLRNTRAMHSLWGAPALLDPRTREIIAPRSEAPGVAEFSGLPAGRYIATYAALARWASRLPISDGVPPGVRGFATVEAVPGTRAEVDLPDPGEPCWVAGRVVRGTDPPVRTLDIFPAGLDAATASSRAVGLDDDGAFEAGAYPAGDYLVRTFTDPSRPVSMQPVSLDPGTAVELEVRGP